MKNILVPVDFSDISKNALKFATHVAQASESKIILFHVIQPLLIASDTGNYVYPHTEDGKEYEKNTIYLERLIDYVNMHNVNAEKIIHKGNFIEEEIANLIEENEIDMIIIGSRVTNEAETFFFGANSVKIFEKVKCPVLIIPPKTQYRGIMKMMYAIDFHNGDLKELKKAIQFAKIFNAEVIITHINTNPTKFEEEEDNLEWVKGIDTENISYEKISSWLVHNKNITVGLEKAAIDLNADILCMAIDEKNLFEKIFTKSYAREIAYTLRIPLMVMHLNS